MSRMTRWAARLYPRWWRERYGEEFAALLDDTNPGTRGAFDILKGALAMQMTTLSAKRAFCLTVLSGLLPGLLAGLVVAFTLTPQYSSKAALEILGTETNLEALTPVKATAQQIFGRGTLIRLIQDLNLYPNLRQKKTLEDLLETMRRDIRVSFLRASKPIFQVEFRYPDSAIAQRTVSALTAEFEKFGFNVTSPASRSYNPIFPNRLNFSMMGLAIGTAFGFVAALTVHLRRRVKHAA